MMNVKSQLQNIDYLKTDQHRDSRNLSDRAQLHQRYASNPQGWFEWVMDHLSVVAGNHILECGCGPGWLWRNNLQRIPNGCQITLTDLSPGMVAEAEAALSSTSHDFRFFDADVMQLPLEDHEFDIVIANHMLYHVSDRQKALAEVRRVLKEDGRFIAATIGQNHMLELRDVRKELSPQVAIEQRQTSGIFSLENGRSQLAPCFKQIELFKYPNQLLVTDVNDLLAYVLSSSQARKEVDKDRLVFVSQIVQKTIDEQGYFKITTDSGLFRASNKI
jgi:SAM-dependent methyltransferase